jgi:hypothetical protein
MRCAARLMDCASNQKAFCWARMVYTTPLVFSSRSTLRNSFSCYRPNANVNLVIDDFLFSNKALPQLKCAEFVISPKRNEI